MPAPTGNRNAQKWTLERTLEVLTQIENLSHSSDCLYLGQALSLVGYYDDVWAYWRRKWKGNYEVIHRMKRVLQRFEVRLFEKMAYRAIAPRVAMFALTHHYKWGKDESKAADLRYIEDMDEAEDEEPETEGLLTESGNPDETTHTEEQEEIVPPNNTLDYVEYKLKKYNRLNPENQILVPASYFDGKPPRRDAILFEDGYFLKGAGYV